MLAVGLDGGAQLCKVLDVLHDGLHAGAGCEVGKGGGGGHAAALEGLGGVLKAQSKRRELHGACGGVVALAKEACEGVELGLLLRQLGLLLGCTHGSKLVDGGAAGGARVEDVAGWAWKTRDRQLRETTRLCGAWLRALTHLPSRRHRHTCTPVRRLRGRRRVGCGARS